jgi:hypothetical protein
MTCPSSLSLPLPSLLSQNPPTPRHDRSCLGSQLLQCPSSSARSLSPATSSAQRGSSPPPPLAPMAASSPSSVALASRLPCCHPPAALRLRLSASAHPCPRDLAPPLVSTSRRVWRWFSSLVAQALATACDLIRACSPSDGRCCASGARAVPRLSPSRISMLHAHDTQAPCVARLALTAAGLSSRHSLDTFARLGTSRPGKTGLDADEKQQD